MIEISRKNGLVRRKLLIFLIVVAMFISLVAIGPSVLDRYTVNILIRSFLYATVVLTVDLLWGYTGILSFGQSALFAVGAYSAGLMFTHLGFGPIHAVVALFGGIFVAMIVGWLVGWISFWHRATPFYVAVIDINKKTNSIEYYSTSGAVKKDLDSKDLIETEMTKTIPINIDAGLINKDTTFLIGFILDKKRIELLN